VNPVLNRGARRELIFLDDEDRQRFVATLGEACAKTGWHEMPRPKQINRPPKAANHRQKFEPRYLGCYGIFLSVIQ
jgi:hypothetical protein